MGPMTQHISGSSIVRDGDVSSVSPFSTGALPGGGLHCTDLEYGSMKHTVFEILSTEHCNAWLLKSTHSRLVEYKYLHGNWRLVDCRSALHAFEVGELLSLFSL